MKVEEKGCAVMLRLLVHTDGDPAMSCKSETYCVDIEISRHHLDPVTAGKLDLKTPGTLESGLKKSPATVEQAPDRNDRPAAPKCYHHTTPPRGKPLQHDYVTSNLRIVTWLGEDMPASKICLAMGTSAG